MPTERAGGGVAHGSGAVVRAPRLGDVDAVGGGERHEADEDEEGDRRHRSGAPHRPPYHDGPEVLMRVCFINENIGGHGTLHHHLRIALEDHPEVDARTVDVHPAGRLHRAFRAPIPGLAELDLDLNVLRDHVAGSVVARRRVGRLEPGTVVHLYTQSIGSTLTEAAARPPLRRGHRCHAAPRARACCRSGSRPATPTGSRGSSVGSSAASSTPPPCSSPSPSGRRAPCADDYGIDDDRIRIVPYGILMGERPDVAVGDPPIITWTGRSLERKGGARLLRIWRERLAPARPPAPDHAGRGAARSPASR